MCHFQGNPFDPRESVPEPDRLLCHCCDEPIPADGKLVHECEDHDFKPTCEKCARQCSYCCKDTCKDLVRRNRTQELVCMECPR